MLFVLEISFTNFISFINFIEWLKSIDKKSKILTKLHINVSFWNIHFLLVYVYLLKLFSNSRSLTPMCILMIAPWNLYICVTNVHTWILTLYLFFSHIIYTFKVAFDFTYRWAGMGLYACIYALFAMICRKSKVRSLQLIVSAVIFRVQGPLMHWTIAQNFAIPNWSQRYLPRNYCIACDTCLSWIICKKLSSWYCAIDYFRYKI